MGLSIPELRKLAAEAKAVGDTNLSNILEGAADDMLELCHQIDGTVRVAADALRRLKEAGLE